jgi:23S rRNA pseudouridine1911/1915/1917 synthase
MMDYERKGDWLSLPWPKGRETSDVDLADLIKPMLPVPEKWILKLDREGGIRRQGQRLMLRLFPPESIQFMPEYSELEVLFEDDFCLVVNKPAGMSVHPSDHGQSGTLANAVAYYYESTGQSCAVRHIHRLDKDTTGAVLYAKNEMAHLVLDEAMRHKRIERIYVALVEGRLVVRKGTIQEPIGKDRHISGKRRVSKNGYSAVTHYEVLEQYMTGSLVRLQLETGRTHQIRVHLSHIGHPIIGDALYGADPALFERQALHGEQLLFQHPFTQEHVSLQAPWPEDFNRLADRLRRKSKN